MKICIKCGVSGDECLFVKKENVCKGCRREYKENYRIENKENIALKRKQYYEENKKEISEKAADYYLNNKEHICTIRKIYYYENQEKSIAYSKQYASDNTEEIRNYQAEYRSNHKLEITEYKRNYHKKRRKTDINFKLKTTISSNISKYLKDKDLSKNNISILNHLPFKITIFKLHIESLFAHPDNLTPLGEVWMTWENWGKYNPNTWIDNDYSTHTWQLDHIIPHSTFHYKSMDCEEFRKCWSLDNLRPYSAKLNSIDGARRIRHRK